MNNHQNNINNDSKHDFDPSKYVAIYARTSIKAANYSIDAQISDCTKRLREEKLFLYKTYHDKESGTKVRFYERKGFKELLSDLEAGMFKTIIISKRDRLSRNLDDFMHLKHIFKKYKIRVIFAKELAFEYNDKNYISRFLDNMLVALATLEPNTTAKRTEDGKKFSRGNGNFSSGICAYGYERGKDKHSYVKIDDKADKVKKVYNLFLQVGNKQESGLEYTLENFKEDMKALFPHKKSQACEFAYNIIKRPTYVAKMPQKGQTSLEQLIEVVDEAKDEYRIKEELLIDCNKVDKIIEDFNIWKEAALKLFKLVLRYRDEKRKVLLQKLVYCKKCKKAFVLKRDIANESNTFYECDENCTTLKENKFLQLIFSKLITDSDSTIFKSFLELNLQELEKIIYSEQKKLQEILKQSRDSTREYIANCKSNSREEEFREKIQVLKEKQTTLKSSINLLGEQKMVLNYILNNIEIYKDNLPSRLNDTHIEYFKNSYELLNTILSKLVKKVVLSTNSSHEYSVDIHFNKGKSSCLS